MYRNLKSCCFIFVFPENPIHAHKGTSRKKRTVGTYRNSTVKNTPIKQQIRCQSKHQEF
jgi:hypothetical protein